MNESMRNHPLPDIDNEQARLDEDAVRSQNWKRWGPYLAERQWSTVREDYSQNGESWNYFPHDHARSRAYRWGEDGILGITDRECRLCFALSMWNEKDPILKERLFGLTGPEGNHGEDVKECYFYLDSTPTHSYMKGLYKYPQREFPYGRLVSENQQLSLSDREFELTDTGIFTDNRYFDVFVEYAKGSPDDILIKITIVNRGPAPAKLHLLPTLWFRNTWVWGCAHEGCSMKPRIQAIAPDLVETEHETLGKFFFAYDRAPDGNVPRALFTDNHTNAERVFGVTNDTPYVKDAFQQLLIEGRQEAVNPQSIGTKVAPHYLHEFAPGESRTFNLRIYSESDAPKEPFGESFDRIFNQRKKEADYFYNSRIPSQLSSEEKEVCRQGYAGLLWSKQFYHYVLKDWLDGDQFQPPPPAERKLGKNNEWKHFFARDVVSMPDKWEYPWFAAWDLAFHMVPFARIDSQFAKHQLTLFLREWYMHPNGQLPAYEFNFSDVNPPVHAWAAWRVYKISDGRRERDTLFLESVFQKLLLNFTWWVNRKDLEGNNLFSGGFLGLDNIGVFDRSKQLPTGGHLQQADGTAWMAFYCLTMLAISLELATTNPVYEDMASKFFEHFVMIADAINELGGRGLWDDDDGFYYDQLKLDTGTTRLKTRSLVGLLPLIAVTVIDEDKIDKLSGFSKRLKWFIKHRSDLGGSISYCDRSKSKRHRLLSIPSRENLQRMLAYMLDENEFLSKFGIRSLSKVHLQKPYVCYVDGVRNKVKYVPGESDSYLFGGNSNWRGPIWFPINYLIVEALENYHHFYGDEFKVECPTGSGNMMNLQQVADEISRRLATIFLTDDTGARPCNGDDSFFATDQNWRDLILFHEYFHGETGRGLGANHQTGWTALVVRCLESLR